MGEMRREEKIRKFELMNKGGLPRKRNLLQTGNRGELDFGKSDPKFHAGTMTVGYIQYPASAYIILNCGIRGSQPAFHGLCRERRDARRRHVNRF